MFQNNKFGATGGGGNLFGTQTPQNQSLASGMFRTPGLGGATATTGGLAGQAQAAQPQQQTGGGLFGQNNTATAGGLFQSQTPQSGIFRTPGLGGATGTSGGLFGQTQAAQPQQQQTGGGLFGQTNTAAAGGLFQSQTPQQSGVIGGGGNIFQTPTSQATNSLFGGAKAQQTTTPFGNTFGAATAQNGTAQPAFKAPQQSDTVTKNNRTQTIQTRFQTISSMKEYSGKSLEELRLEDYVANRKGAQGGAAAGGLFGAQQQQAAAGGLFGQQTSQAGGLLGQQSTAGGGLFGNQQQQQQQQATAGGLFGNQQKQGTTLFGQTSAAAGLTSQAGGIFGQAGQQQQQAGGLFNQQAGQQQQAAGLFGQQQQTQQQAGGLFAGQKTGLTGLGTTGQTGGLFGGAQQQQGQTGLTLGGGAAGGLFGNKTAAGGLTLGGQTQQAAGGIGLGGAAGGGLFGNTAAGGLTGGLAGGTLGGANQLKLGQTGTLGGGLTAGGLGTTGGLGLTGGLGGQVGATGLGGTGLKLTAGAGLGGGMAGFSSIGGATSTTNSASSQVTSLGTDAATAAQQQAQLQLQLATLHNSPFGDSPLFKTALQDAKKWSKDQPTPASKSSTTTPSHMKVSSKAVARLRPQPLVSRPAAKAQLFDGLESDVPGTLSSPDLFVPRSSVKKLVIKPKAASSPSDSVAASASGTPLRNSTPSTGRDDVTEASMPTMHMSDAAYPQTPLGTMGLISPPQQQQQQTSSTSGGSTRQAADDSVTSLGNDDSFRRPIRRSGRPANVSVTQASPQSPRSGSNLNDSMVTLARGDYYTEPPLDELAAMVNGDGRLVVDKFTIGREGLGEIYYPDTTDLTGVNLDETVFICQSEVTVYPDDERKPEVGEELNKPAIITLHGVWPNDKSTGQAIKSPNRLEIMNYRNKVMKSTAKIGAEFIDYRAESGSWVFKVDHFSKYGLPDEDSDAEDESAAPLKKKKALQSSDPRIASLLSTKQGDQKPESSGLLPLIPSKTAKTHGLDTEEDTDGMMATHEHTGTSEATKQASVNSSSRHFAASIGLNPHRVQLMKASFFTEEGDEDGMDITLGAAPSSSQVYQPSSASDRGLFASNGSDESPGNQSMVMRPGAAVALSPYRRTDSPRMAGDDRQQQHASSTQLPFLAPESSSKLTAHRSALTPRKTLLGGGGSGAAGSMSRLQQQQQQPQHTGLQADIIGSPMPAHIARLPILPSGQAQGTGPRNDALSVASAQRCLLPVPADQSITSGKINVVSDAGLMFGRSFRVGWGQGWRLVHSGSAVSSANKATATSENRLLTMMGKAPISQSSSYCVQIEQLHASPQLQNSSAAKERITRSMQIQLDYTDVSTDTSVPHLTPVNGVEALDCHATEAKQRFDGAANDEKTGLEYSAQVWALTSALWGKLSSANGLGGSPDTGGMDTGLSLSESYGERMARRRAVSQWLSSVTAKDIGSVVQYAASSQVEESYLNALFALLTGQQIAAAARLAIDHGDTNLSRLISQCVGSSSFRENVAIQLQQWMERKTDRFLSQERLRIYCLLAGLMVWQGSDSSVYACACDGVDWRRAFAVHLWYAAPYEASIADGFQRYLQAFKGYSDEDGRVSQPAYAVAPDPHYSAVKASSPSATADDDVYGDGSFHVRDMHFHLLRLYSKQTHRLQRTLDPATHTSFVLDYQLSWPLFCVLKSLNYEHMPTSLVSRLHCDFASQLLALDMWPWAIMVALFIPQRQLRQSFVHEILHRYCRLTETSDLTEEDEFITEQLSVPAEWIHQAKAVRARYEGKHLLTAQHHLLGGQWMACHGVIIKHIASSAIVNGDTNALLSMLEELEPLYRSAMIPGWNRAGQVYLDYLRLCQRMLSGTESSSRQDELNADVVTLCTRLEHLPVRTPLDRLCQANMAKTCSQFIKPTNTFPLLQSLSWCEHGHIGLLSTAVAANIPVV
eukprot:scpid7024/ scgid3908/ Nuclear pore complex protein Nup98-Nup96; Nuclear pore complex protein Nup98; 98 kDa nucleoporin; Nucleoporin Nup98; Nuclear pore complex protein Nup96; 96 kDa nucleoporin; Nucleoporin Nup96